MKKAPIHLIVVDDHPEVRKGIINILEPAEDIVVAGQAASGIQAIDLVVVKKPDAVLLDIELPDLNGLTVLRRLHLMMPVLKVLIVSSYSDMQLIRKAREYGASGYLLKDKIPALLVAAVRRLIYDEVEWIGSGGTLDRLSGLGQTLTKMETDILKQIVLKRPTDMIAKDLGMEEWQVEKHLDFLMKKYQVKSLFELKLIARRIFRSTDVLKLK